MTKLKSKTIVIIRNEKVMVRIRNDGLVSDAAFLGLVTT